MDTPSPERPELLALRVLLVEDCPTDAFVLTDALNQRGVRDVTWVSKLSDALHLLHERAFDVVVTDVSLPDALGIGAIARLRECAPEVPLLVCSDAIDGAVALRAIELGAQACVAKSEVDEALFRALQVARVRRSAQRRSSMRARRDELTGLADRAAFLDTVDRWMLHAEREGSGFAVIVIDLDDFTAVNNNHGCEAGDHLLREVATRIRLCLRDSDVAARSGGDEFAIVTATTHPVELKLLMEGIAWVIAVPVQARVELLSVTARLGVAAFLNDVPDAATLLQRAEVAMYAAKQERSGQALDSAKRERSSWRSNPG